MSEKFTIRYTTWAPPYTPDAPLRRGRPPPLQQTSGGRKAAAGLFSLFQLRFPFLSQLSVTVAGISLEPNSPEYRIVT